MLLLSSADFFQNYLLHKDLPGILSEFLDPDQEVLLVLIWVTGSKPLAKDISRRQKSLLARKELIFHGSF